MLQAFFNSGGGSQSRTDELRFCRPLPYHLAMPPKKWSGKRDLNPRLRPWQGRTLPLSYSRSYKPYFLASSQFFVNKKAQFWKSVRDFIK